MMSRDISSHARRATTTRTHSLAYLHEEILASDGVLRIFSYPSMDFSSLGGGFCPSARKARNHHPQRAAHRAGSRRHAW